MSIELNIVEYDLEGAANCDYDYLEVSHILGQLNDNWIMSCSRQEIQLPSNEKVPCDYCPQVVTISDNQCTIN